MSGQLDDDEHSPLDPVGALEHLMRLLGVLEERSLKLGITVGRRYPDAQEIHEAERLLSSARGALTQAMAVAIPPEHRGPPGRPRGGA